jgi:acyl carrier protein
MAEEDVLKLISEESGVSVFDISPESTLLGDLGIDGDDAWSLLESCSENFGLNLKNFKFQAHFRNEPCFKGPLYFFRKLKLGDEHLAAKKEKITVASLIQACKNGSW